MLKKKKKRFPFGFVVELLFFFFFLTKHNQTQSNTTTTKHKDSTGTRPSPLYLRHQFRTSSHGLRLSQEGRESSSHFPEEAMEGRNIKQNLVELKGFFFLFPSLSFFGFLNDVLPLTYIYRSYKSCCCS